MTTKQVVIAFLVLYLILMGVGGAMYYAIVNPPAQRVETKSNADEAKKNTAEIKVATKKEKELQEKKKKEEEERKAREAEEAKRREESANMEKLREEIEGKMKIVTRGGVTFYTHNRGKEMPGVHLRPFIASKNGNIILKHDIYYYSALDDANYGWIHGSHLDVTADGNVFSYELDPSERRDKLGKGAEDLTESYVMDADKNVVEMLKAVGKATNVTLHYSGDAETVCTLSRADIRRINEMMTLYEIMEKESNGDL